MRATANGEGVLAARKTCVCEQICAPTYRHVWPPCKPCGRYELRASSSQTDSQQPHVRVKIDAKDEHRQECKRTSRSFLNYDKNCEIFADNMTAKNMKQLDGAAYEQASTMSKQTSRATILTESPWRSKYENSSVNVRPSRYLRDAGKRRQNFARKLCKIDQPWHIHRKAGKREFIWNDFLNIASKRVSSI